MARLRLVVCVALFGVVALVAPRPLTAFPDPPRGCCVLGGFEGKCQRTEAECAALGGAWHEGVTCAAQAAYEAPYFDGGAGDPVGCAMDTFGADTDSDGVLDADDACPTIAWNSGGDGTNGDGCPCQIVRRWDWNGSEWVLFELPAGWSHCLPCSNPGPPAVPDGLDGRGGATQYWNCEGCYSGCDRGCCANAETGTLSCDSEEPSCRGASETFTFGDLDCADSHGDLPDYDWCGAVPDEGDNDGDGIGNGSDPDVDGDGIANGDDPDVDGDGTPNGEDSDVNDDGETNEFDTDIDGDGVANGSDDDMDGDGVANGSDPDRDGDGAANGADDTPDGVGSGGGEESFMESEICIPLEGECFGDPLNDCDGDGVPNGQDECPGCRGDLCFDRYVDPGDGGALIAYYKPCSLSTIGTGTCICSGCPAMGADGSHGASSDAVLHAQMCAADTDWDEDGTPNEDDYECSTTCQSCTYCGHLENKISEAWDSVAVKFALDDLSDRWSKLWVAPPCECEEGEDPDDCEERCDAEIAAWNKIPILTIPLPTSIMGRALPQDHISLNLRPYFDERVSPYARFLDNGLYLFRKLLLGLFLLGIIPKFIKAIDA